MIHKLFPTAVYQVALGTEWTQPVIDLADELAENKLNLAGTTSDLKGYSDYHQRPELAGLFEAVAHHTRLYLNALGYAQQNFELWATKTWIVDSQANKDSIVGEHTHPSSDISMVYYARNDGSAPIEFLNTHQPNETFGMSNLHDWPVRRAVTEFNCQAKSQPAQAGDLIIFPSKLAHRVPARPASRRISLSSDMIMTVKPALKGVEFTRNSPVTWKNLL
jgi:uncharacterized protein (TIGR02466 family)